MKSFSLFVFLFFASVVAEPCELSVSTKNFNNLAKVVSYEKCEFVPPETRKNWEKTKQGVIDFAKSFEGVAICPSSFLEGMRQQLAEDVDSVYNALASYAHSDPVKSALAVRAAAVSMIDGLRNSPQAFEDFIRGIPEIPSQVYDKVSLWMRGDDCQSTLSSQRAMCVSAGVMFVAMAGSKGGRVSALFDRSIEKELIWKIDPELRRIDVSNVPVLEYKLSNLTVSSFDVYKVESSFFRGSKKALLLSENERSFGAMSDVAKFNPGTQFTSTSIDRLPESKLRNLETKALDNTKAFPAEWKNKFDRVLMNNGLCLCNCSHSTCGGIESSTVEAKGFLSRVTDVLDKSNKNSRAVLTANQLPSNTSGPTDLKIWIESASQVMREANVEIRVFQREGRLLQIEVRPR